MNRNVGFSSRNPLVEWGEPMSIIGAWCMCTYAVQVADVWGPANLGVRMGRMGDPSLRDW